MTLKTKGLLSGCEQMFTPMSSDKEGKLRGGFGGFSVASNSSVNVYCVNEQCVNVGCSNGECYNGECGNDGCHNSHCYVLTKAPTPEPSQTTTQMPLKDCVVCGFL